MIDQFIDKNEKQQQTEYFLIQKLKSGRNKTIYNSNFCKQNCSILHTRN